MSKTIYYKWTVTVTDGKQDRSVTVYAHRHATKVDITKIAWEAIRIVDGDDFAKRAWEKSLIVETDAKRTAGGITPDPLA